MSLPLEWLTRCCHQATIQCQIQAILLFCVNSGDNLTFILDPYFVISVILAPFSQKCVSASVWLYDFRFKLNLRIITVMPLSIWAETQIYRQDELYSVFQVNLQPNHVTESHFLTDHLEVLPGFQGDVII